MLKFVDVTVCLCSWGWSASGTAVCLFDLYLVVLTFSPALKVASLVTDTDAWKIQSNSVLNSEYDLETQTWCLSVNEEAYPTGTKTQPNT